MIIGDMLRAAKLGNELSDPAKWKRGQKLTNRVVLFLGAILALVRVKYPEVLISDETLMSLAGIVGGVLVVINDYLTTATTKKIGLE